MLQCLYPINPDENGRYFSEQEIENIAKEISQKPFIFASNELGLDLDPAIPVGAISQVGFADDPITNVKGFVFMYQVSEDACKQLNEIQNSLIELRVKPYIVGLLEIKEDKNFVIGSRVTNIELVS